MFVELRGWIWVVKMPLPMARLWERHHVRLIADKSWVVQDSGRAYMPYTFRT
jgi:hypothetical protein